MWLSSSTTSTAWMLLKTISDSGDPTTKVTVRKAVIGKTRKKQAISRIVTMERVIVLQVKMIAMNLQAKRRKRMRTLKK
jgi:hypothetical protein